MEKKLKKNSFLQGTIIASAALIFIKILGALYVIPFYKIIGEEGGTLYSYAYSIYNLFLNVSTAGIPIAMSMIISEYLTLNMYDAKERSYKVGKYMVSILALVSFAIVFFASPLLAKFILSDTVGGHSIEDVSFVIKAISFCLLIIPFLSILRGYLQGHKFIASTSAAQVIEQVVRILIVIFGSYVAIRILKLSVLEGVSVALLGTFFGGLAAYIYLRVKVHNNKKEFPTSDKKDKVTNKVLAKKILTYCVPLVLMSVTDNIYTLVDIRLIIKGLSYVGYTAMQSEIVSGIASTWAPKICTLIVVISTALITNIVPNVTSAYVQKDYKTVNRRVNQALQTMLIIALPMTILLFMLSNESYYIFYGTSKYGNLMLRFSSISHMLLGIWLVLNSTLQSMKKFKAIYTNSILGLVVNALLDIPIIMLLSKLGLPAYIGSILATCIGYSVSIIVTLAYLKKDMDFEYKSTFNLMKKLILPIILIIVPIYLFNKYVNLDLNIINSFIRLGVCGIYGVLIYGFVTYKNGALESVLGEAYLNKIFRKLHLKRED